MDDITITIKPPVTEYCTKCDYRASYSFHSNHVKCPKCGEDSVTGVHSSRTTSIWVSTTIGNYDWARPGNKQTSYRFYNIPDGYKSQYVVDDGDIDTSDPLECATELKNVIDKYLYSSSKGEISKLVDYLQEVDEQQYELRTREKREELEFELYKLLHTNSFLLEGGDDAGS